MTLWKGSKVELIAALVAAIGIPFYLGLTHSGAAQFLVYCAIAGTAMATGEFVEASHLQRGGWRLFVTDVAVWFSVVLLLGTAAYFCSLLF